jgi:uncharacterized protein
MSGETRLYFRGGVKRRDQRVEFICGQSVPTHHEAMQYLIATLIGLAGGVASGLFGVGGGIIMVPAMVFFMQMDMKLAVGTSLAVIIPTAMSGVAKHFQLGQVDWKIALSLAPTAICGSYMGAWLTKDISSGNLKRAFGGLLIFAGARLLLGK